MTRMAFTEKRLMLMGMVTREGRWAWRGSGGTEPTVEGAVPSRCGLKIARVYYCRNQLDVAMVVEKIRTVSCFGP
jgi:hypothetical protein